MPTCTKEYNINNIYGFLIDRTIRVLRRNLQNLFRNLDADLTVDQWVLLNVLRDQSGLTQIELAEASFKDGPTITKIIDLLEKKGLAAREPFPNDRRKYSIRITKKGKDLIEHLLPKVQAYRDQGWKGLTDKDFKDLKRIMNTIYNNITYLVKS